MRRIQLVGMRTEGSAASTGAGGGDAGAVAAGAVVLTRPSW